MLTQKLKKYIDEHSLCPDYLFDNWEEFLDLVYDQGSRVESVLWFEHVAIDRQQASLGGGGYRDKTEPDYMYAETFICEKTADKSLSELKQYILSVLKAHPNNKLMPSFFIDE